MFFFTIYNLFSHIFSFDPHNYPRKQAGERCPVMRQTYMLDKKIQCVAKVRGETLGNHESKIHVYIHSLSTRPETN